MNPLQICLFLFCSSLAFGQAQIQFDSTFFDYGRVLEGSPFKKEIRFKNVGNEPLLITRASTGDGGSMASYSRNPILPGQSDVIIFHYDSKRIGKFEKCINISSNSKPSASYCDFKVKGEIIRHPTRIEIAQKEKNIGNLAFGEVDTIQFELTNAGEKNLYLWFYKTSYQETDLLRYAIQSRDSADKDYRYYSGTAYYYPNEKVLVTLLVKNLYGNTGAFRHNLALCYNAHDTLTLSITGNFIGEPTRQTIHEGDYVFFYENGKLIKREQYTESGRLLREDFFEGSDCVRSTRYHWHKNVINAEYFYKNGRLIEMKNFQVPND